MEGESTTLSVSYPGSEYNMVNISRLSHIFSIFFLIFHEPLGDWTNSKI